MDRNLAFGTVKLQLLTLNLFWGTCWTSALLLCAVAKASLEQLNQVPLKFLLTNLLSLWLCPVLGSKKKAAWLSCPCNLACTPKSIISSLRTRVITLDNFFPHLTTLTKKLCLTHLPRVCTVMLCRTYSCLTPFTVHVCVFRREFVGAS